LISVVIPTLNEAARLPALLAELRAETPAPEIIVSDGGSTDRTAAIAAAGGARCISGPPGRGAQLARGVDASHGSVVLMLHADSRFPGGGLAAIEAALAVQPAAPGGNFRLLFDGNDGFSRWLESFYAWLRRRGVYYGDSGIFIRRAALDALGGIRPIALMEDFDLVRRMERAGPTICIAVPALTTSSRRFAGRGRAAIVAGWLRLHLLHALGVSPDRLAAIYDSARERAR
jgi:rSAM/selenodomain-associated transferase 2